METEDQLSHLFSFFGGSERSSNCFTDLAPCLLDVPTQSEIDALTGGGINQAFAPTSLGKYLPGKVKFFLYTPRIKFCLPTGILFGSFVPK